MSVLEEEFETWKSETRQESLEKGYLHLKLQNKKQLQKIEKLKRWLYVPLLGVIALFAVLIATGNLNLPMSASHKSSNLNNTAQASQKTDTLYLMGTPPNYVKPSIIYCVQIGAYTDKKLEKYEASLTSNMNLYQYQDLNQISLGLFVQFSDAESFLKTIKRMGMRDAFIIAIKDGRRLKI